MNKLVHLSVSLRLRNTNYLLSVDKNNEYDGHCTALVDKNHQYCWLWYKIENFRWRWRLATVVVVSPLSPDIKIKLRRLYRDI